MQCGSRELRDTDQYPRLVSVNDATNNDEQTSRALILKSALTEIEKSGIVGMRLSAVAEGAFVSIPLISRHFGGRDGLLAAVLGDWYENFVFRYRGLVDNWLETSESITHEEFVLLSPKPGDASWKKDREFRLKVLAASLENPQLRARITEITREVYKWVVDVIEHGIPKLPEADRHFDKRIFTLLLFNTMFIFSDMLEESISDVEYHGFMVDLFRASSWYRSSQRDI